MDPVIAATLITASVGITSAILTFINNRKAEAIKKEQAENATQFDSVKLRLDLWTELVTNLRAETDRKDGQLVIKDAKIVALEQTIDHLRKELRDCHDKSSQIRIF